MPSDQSNIALVTMTAVAVKALTACAPNVNLTQLSTLELMEFRSELVEAEAIVGQVKKNLALELELRLAAEARNREEFELSQPEP